MAKSRPGVPRYPLAIERSYRAALDRRVRETHRALMREIKPELTARLDAERADDGLTAAMLLEVIRKAVQRIRLPIPESLLSRIARQIETFSSRETQRAVERAAAKAGRLAVPRIDPSGGATDATRAAWIRRNVDLITSIDERYFSDIEAVVSEAARTGTRSEVLAKDLQRRYQVSRSRAKLIARDQTAKLNGQIARRQQEALGVSGYIWRTSEDERVRDTHEPLNGTRQSWARAPSVGHPGEDFQCRCTAEPVL